jgi:hypothetical protein
MNANNNVACLVTWLRGGSKIPSKIATIVFAAAHLPACQENKPPTGSSSAPTSISASPSAAATAVASGASLAGVPAGAEAPPASPGPSKSVLGECTFEFTSPGLPTHDPGAAGSLDQWINPKTHVVLGLFRETAHAAFEPRTLADIEKKHKDRWDAPVSKGAANGVGFAVFRTGVSNSDEEVRAIGATEASNSAVACTFDISGPSNKEAEISALAKSMRITIAKTGK